MEFTQLTTYIESKTTIQGRINAIETLIDSVLMQMISAVDTGNNIEYLVDNGQSKIMLKYRSPDEVAKVIQTLEKTKQIYVNRLNGRVMRSMDTKIMNPKWY
jgi:hypothetical protein